ncbi:nitroreductase family protein [Vibrio vulnificus]|nr:nitroreductase family protein [Vibrio vulnificus]
MKIKNYLKKNIILLFDGKVYLKCLNLRVLKQLILAFFYDFKVFYKNSSIFFSELDNERPISAKNKGEVEAKLLFNVHKIEKGLSNKNIKYAFGENVIREICKLLTSEVKNSLNKEIVQYSVATLHEYDRIHKDSKQFHAFQKDAKFNELLSSYDGNLRVGVMESVRVERAKDYFSVVNSRVSCREFTTEKVSEDKVKSAIELALKTPSVCNRQLWKVRYFEGEDCKEVLSLQNGNATFSEYINEVLLISVDIRGLLSPFERNQGYVDGGLFGMSVINALHYYDIASCALNWASSIEQNVLVHRKNIVPENESVIMAIAIGNYPDKFNYPVSIRKPIEEVFIRYSTK